MDCTAISYCRYKYKCADMSLSAYQTCYQQNMCIYGMEKPTFFSGIRPPIIPKRHLHFRITVYVWLFCEEIQILLGQCTHIQIMSTYGTLSMLNCQTTKFIVLIYQLVHSSLPTFSIILSTSILNICTVANNYKNEQRKYGGDII